MTPPDAPPTVQPPQYASRNGSWESREGANGEREYRRWCRECDARLDWDHRGIPVCLDCERKPKRLIPLTRGPQ